MFPAFIQGPRGVCRHKNYCHCVQNVDFLRLQCYSGCLVVAFASFLTDRLLQPHALRYKGFELRMLNVDEVELYAFFVVTWLPILHKDIKDSLQG